ncbi:MAG: leucine-rich repeat domain-containing protein [Bacteroidaceae bacterium]|nr:leucine-rich repeat domain-containing protein [Bacteroidaceae bacterium]
MKKILLFIFLSTISVSLQAYDFAVQSGTNTIYFNIIDNVNNYVEVTQQNVSGSFYSVYPTDTVIIPSNVVNNQINYSVRAIGNYAFSGCDAITFVSLPSSVTLIGNEAFYNCTNLNKVSLSNSLKVIGYSSFNNCISLDSISLPNSLTVIGDYAFKKCSTLTSIIIPDSITTIGFYTFDKCLGLTSISFPSSLTTINNYAFNECSGLTSLTFPNSLQTIGEYAFYKCGGITSINLSNSLTTLGYSAFSNCVSLTSITLPNSLLALSANVFNNCTNLSSVTLPDSINYIGSYAFSSSKIKSISFPTSLDSLGWGIFMGCYLLDTIFSYPLNPPKISNNTFSSIYNTLVIVPCGYNTVYQAANHWSNFTNIRGANDIMTEYSDTICMGENYNQYGFNFVADTSGVYIQDLSRVDGCDSIIKLNLFVVPELERPSNMFVDLYADYIEVRWFGSAEDYELYRNDTLIALVTGVYDYLGTYLDSNLISGTRYCYKVRAVMNNCFSQMSEVYCKTFIGIEDVETQSKEITIYPNPNNGRFILSSESIIENKSIEVFDIRGKLLMTYNLNPSEKEHNVDLSTLEKGIYTITIKANNQKTFKKLIIQ